MSTASDYIESKSTIWPKVGVVLGSGLGAFADTLRNPVIIPYDEIPGWPRSTVAGHAGRIVLGMMEGLAVAALAGRAHLYEGHTAQDVVFGIRTLDALGVGSVVLTNAAGAINESYHPGQLVLISDHINLTGQNPLTGPNDESMGPRFPDMSEAYSVSYRECARQAGKGMGIELAQGIYAAVAGPSYETPAEIRYLRTIGADLVGMSTVPEAIAANHLGMKVLAISCVTNMAAGVTNQKMNHEEVLETGERVRDTIVELLHRVLPKLAETSA